MEIQIQVETRDSHLLFDLLGKSSIKLGDEVDIPGRARLRYADSLEFKAALAPHIFTIVLGFSTSVAASLVANYIWDKLKGKVEKVTIEKTEITSANGIVKIIQEKITKS